MDIVTFGMAKALHLLWKDKDYNGLYYSQFGLLLKPSRRATCIPFHSAFEEVKTGNIHQVDASRTPLFYAPNTLEILSKMPGFSLIYMGEGKRKWGCYGLGTLFNSSDGTEIDMEENPADACAKAWIRIRKTW